MPATATAIVAVTALLPDDKDGETEFHIKPLFVSVVDGRVLTDHLRQPSKHHKEGGQFWTPIGGHFSMPIDSPG